MSYTHSTVRFASLIPALAPIGCEYPQFDSTSHVGELRILGLQSDHAINAPGANVHLTALWADGRTTQPGDVTRAWFKGCTNPPLDSVQECAKQLNRLGAPNADGWPAGLTPVFGDQADFQIATDALEHRDSFGTEVYFFAACRGGTLSYLPSTSDVLPVACRTASGAPVDPSSFAVGYRSLLILPGVPALGDNPVIDSIQVGIDTFTPDCVGEACVDFAWPNCGPNECAEVRACEKPECEPAKVMAQVDTASAEVDLVASPDGSKTERLWARYFVDHGQVDPQLQILHEPDGEWATRAESDLLVPPSTTRLWAVVYDSTGGVSWAGLALRAR
jgi:hypothetical protein